MAENEGLFFIGPDELTERERYVVSTLRLIGDDVLREDAIELMANLAELSMGRGTQAERNEARRMVRADGLLAISDPGLRSLASRILEDMVELEHACQDYDPWQG